MSNNQQQGIQVITNGPFSSKMVQLSKVMSQNEIQLNSLLVSVNPRIQKVADEAFAAYSTLLKKFTAELESISKQTSRSANPSRLKNNKNQQKAHVSKPGKAQRKAQPSKKAVKPVQPQPSKSTVTPKVAPVKQAPAAAPLAAAAS